MIDERVLDRVADLKTKETSQTGHPRKGLVRALTLLLAGLRDGDNSSSREAGPATHELEQWEDESYCYLEIKLAGRPVPGIDVSVSGGRAFIRLER